MSENNKIAFVILHYQNIDVTHECVHYLLQISKIQDTEIVIVDNASPNKSGEILRDEYKAYNNMHIIVNESNMGFSAGNNIGYRYAKDKLHCTMIIVMNSDCFIKNLNFIDELNSAKRYYADASILAPDIILKNGAHQNPYLLKPIPSVEQKKIIRRKEVGLCLYSIPLLGDALLHRDSVKNYQPYHAKKIDHEILQLVPHGACLIYLPNWIKREEIAFVEGTFLFVEEELLFDYCLYRNHHIIYDPDLTVFHMEDASQNSINKNLRKKKIFQIKNEIKSRKLLLKKRQGYKK